MFAFFSLLFIVTAAYGQDCDQVITLTEENYRYYASTPHNPEGDPSEMSCNWTAESPDDTQISFTCQNDGDVEECGNEIVVWEDEANKATYCRKNDFTHISGGNRLMVTYTTPPNSQNGFQLHCRFKLVQD